MQQQSAPTSSSRLKAAATSCHTRIRAISARAAAAGAAAPAGAAADASVPAPPPLPATYSRLVATRTGSSFSEVAELQTLPLPRPGSNEVLVKFAYAGINGGCETFRARGEHAFEPNRTKPLFPLGAEGSGVVAALGSDVQGLSVGQAVAVNGASAFAEYGLASPQLCTPVPAATPEAAALVLSGVVAAAALEATARVAPGDVVLVTAAAGGTGHFAVQLARLAGARVIAVTSTAAKVAALQQLGPERVINYREEDVSAVLAAEYPGGADVMYEGVGGALRRALVPHLAPGGRLLQVGYIAEYPHTRPGAAMEDDEQPVEQGVRLSELFWRGSELQLDGGRRVIGQVWPKDVAAIRRCKRRVFKLHADGQLAAWVDTSHGFKGVGQVANAVDYMLRGGHIGKVVIPL